jgi:tetratricopeptide (TPR) repeat protein
LQRGIAANPANLNARLELIKKQREQGDIDRAIQEYMSLLKDVPAVWPDLAQLLMTRALQQPESQRDWAAIEAVIRQGDAALPGRVETQIMKALLARVRGQIDEARAILTKAQEKFPDNADIQGELADLDGLQGKPDQALARLSEARKKLGDRVTLRLRQAYWELAGGEASPEEALSELASNLDKFSPDDRRRLLEGLALYAIRFQQQDAAISLMKQLAQDDPSNVMARVQLFRGALKSNDEAELRRIINELEKIEGADRLLSVLCEADYLIWRAGQAKQSPEQRDQDRAAARSILDELAARRPDWTELPLAYARLDEQELDRPDLTEQQHDQIRDSLIGRYTQAINGGQRDLLVIHRAIQLLFEAKRYDEVDRLISRLPANSLSFVTGDLERMANLAMGKQDYERAIEIARKAVAVKPEELEPRIWLAEVLRRGGQVKEGENELRQAVKTITASVAPRIVLVQYLIRTGEIQKAEEAIREAEAAFPKDQAALALAQCHESLAQGYRDAKQADKAKAEEDLALRWYQAAAAARPSDTAIRRQIVRFFLLHNRGDEAVATLRKILDDPAANPPSEISWARRNLALHLMATGGPEGARQALALFQKPGVVVDQPDDQRTLAKILLAQGDKEHRVEAASILEKLVTANQALADDRLLLGEQYESDGELEKAREQYRIIANMRPDNPLYVTRYVSLLIRIVDGGTSSTDDIEEARSWIDRLKSIGQPDDFEPVALEVRLLKAEGKAEEAVKRIQEAASRPQHPPLAMLAILSERMNQQDLAESLWRRQAEDPDRPEGRLDLALFLGRTGRIGAALDECEKVLFKTQPQMFANACFHILPREKADPEQTGRVAGWLQKWIEKEPKETVLISALASLREQMGQYPEAETLYRQLVALNTDNAGALNNLAWLLTLRGAKDGQAPLDLVNRAIQLEGPRPEFLDTRGMVYLKSGETRHAVEDLEKAVAADPSASNFFHLAESYLRAGDKARARQSLGAAKAKGLDVSALHPLESSSYQQIVAAIEAP